MTIIPQNTTVAIDIDKAVLRQDFVLLVKNIIKFAIVQKSQIPPSQNYDSLKRIKEAKCSLTVLPKDLSDPGDISNLRKKRKNARIKERNNNKIASYIEEMERLFDAVNSGLEIAKDHEKLYIFLGGTIASSKAGICIKLPRLENNPKESTAPVKLQSKVLSGLLSNGAAGFFAKRVPITNLHICLSTNQELASTRVYDQLGCRRTRLLTIEFQISTPQNVTLSEVNENVEEMINNFSLMMTPMEGQKSVKKRKSVRRLTFSTPIHKGETPPFLRRQRLISGDSGNVSGIQSFDSFIEDSHLCLADPDPQFELKTYRLGFPVKGLKLMRVKEAVNDV